MQIVRKLRRLKARLTSDRNSGTASLPQSQEWMDLLAQSAAIYGGDAGGRRSPERLSPNPLEELGAKYLPSKRNHNYLRFYHQHFAPLRNSAGRVLEIGVETPRSLSM